jgi:DNA repair exonuclease SbcCD ATPase subunit
MTPNKIRFPVLRRLRVTGYELFPGKNRNGLDHTFESGVTVVVGVNGLGKTTLLNMILRSLLGFNAPRKFDPYDPGAGVHIMTEQESDYFAARTSNFAEGATVDAEFMFGKTKVQVVRRLRDLVIERLRVNGKEVKGEQHDLQHEIVKASGLTNLYDFFYIVRSFTFVLEDKVALIWNPRGQFEIFRILFFAADRAKMFAELQDEILQLDSAYRNRRHHVNRRVKELQAVTTDETEQQNLREQLRLKQVDVNTLEEKDADLRQQIDQALNQKAELLEKLEKQRLTLEEEQREFEGLLSSYFSRAYPDLPAVVTNVLNHLVSGQGCLVCGTAPVKKQAEYQRKAERGVCPFCDTDVGAGGKPRPLPAKTSEELKALEESMREMRKSIALVQKELAAAQADLDGLYATRATVTADFASARVAADQLRNRLPASDEDLDENRKAIDQAQRELRKMKAEIEEKTSNYAKMLGGSRKMLEDLSVKLTERFAYYAGQFLAENCNLSYREEMRRLGQEGELLAFPNFEVQMTSATSPKVGTVRSDDSQVSESQKEFVDLAFRMALFDAVRQPGDGVMLVIETPEASLDTVFVDRAGELLRKFANENSGQHNVVLASSNLTHANMVRSLLGIDSLSKKQVAKEVPKRLINLLEIAAPNASVRNNRAAYDRELARSLRKS